MRAIWKYREKAKLWINGTVFNLCFELLKTLLVNFLAIDGKSNNYSLNGLDFFVGTSFVWFSRGQMVCITKVMTLIAYFL